MHVTDTDIQKLAFKLIETFSWQDAQRRGFERYWPLVGLLGTFSEHATGSFEQAMAKALQNALEALLTQTSPKSFHMDAIAVAEHLGATPEQPRLYKPKRRTLHQRRRYRR